MHVKIQTSLKSNGNKGTSAQLVNYMEKKEREEERIALKKGELPPERSGFFDHNLDKIYKHEVIEKMDGNKLSLSKSDAKYYSVTISPSEKEQKHLLKKITGREINDLADLSKIEKKVYENELMKYSRNAMDLYALNFKRDFPRSGNHLLYFGKVEHEREHKGLDEDVKNGNKKSGEIKEGLNSHIHIIVSRNGHDNKIKLSPLAKERGHVNSSILNGKTISRGFDRDLFKLRCQNMFDKEYGYERPLQDRIEYLIQKSKGSESLDIKEDKKDIEHSLILNFYNDKNRKDVPEYEKEKEQYLKMMKEKEKHHEINGKELEL